MSRLPAIQVLENAAMAWPYPASQCKKKERHHQLQRRAVLPTSPEFISLIAGCYFQLVEAGLRKNVTFLNSLGVRLPHWKAPTFRSCQPRFVGDPD